MASGNLQHYLESTRRLSANHVETLRAQLKLAEEDQAVVENLWNRWFALATVERMLSGENSGYGMHKISC